MARDLHADRAALPGLDLLGVPQADRRHHIPTTPGRRPPDAEPPAHPADEALRPAAARPARLPGGRSLVLGGVGVGQRRARRSRQAFARRRLVVAVVDGGDVAAPPAPGCARLFAVRAGAAPGPSERGRRLGRRPVVVGAARPRCSRRWLDRAGRALAPSRRRRRARDPRRGRRRALRSPATCPRSCSPPSCRCSPSSRSSSSDWLERRRSCVLTLPLLPVFAALVGLATRDRRPSAVARRWPSLSGHFLDVVRGLPTLVAYGRAGARSRRIREVSRPLPPGHDGDPAPRLRVLGGARAGRDALGRAGRGHGRPAARRRRPRPRHRRWSRSCWPPRPTGRCAGSARSSTPPPRAPWPSTASSRSSSARPTRRPPPPTGAGGRRRRGRGWASPTRTAGPPAPVLARPRPRGRARAHRRDRPVRGRQVDAARARGRAAHARPPAPSRARRVHLVHPAAVPRRRHGARQPRARPPGAPTTSSGTALRRGRPRRVVAALPRRPATALGDDGFGLSAGQRARLALARAGSRRRPGGAPRRADRPPRRRGAPSTGARLVAEPRRAARRRRRHPPRRAASRSPTSTSPDAPRAAPEVVA